MAGLPHTGDTNIDAKGLRLSIQPSLFSGSICFLIVLFVALGPVGFQAFHVNSLREIWDSAQTIDTSTVQGAYQAVYGEPTLTHIFNTAFLFMLWSFLGLLAYCSVVGIYDALRNIVGVRKEAHYVNATRAHPVRIALTRLAVRCVILIVWSGYGYVFLRGVLPYGIALLHIASQQWGSEPGLAYTLLGCLLLWTGLHIHVVLCRLLLLRVRVFHSEPYV